MSSAFSSSIFLSRDVGCELYLLFVNVLIAFFATYLFVVLHGNPKQLFHNLGDIQIVKCRLFS